MPGPGRRGAYTPETRCHNEKRGRAAARGSDAPLYKSAGWKLKCLTLLSALILLPATWPWVSASLDISGSILTRWADPAYALRRTAAVEWLRPLRHTASLCGVRNHGYTRTFSPSPAIYGHPNKRSVICVTRTSRRLSF